MNCKHEDERLKRALDDAHHRWMASAEMRQIRHWALGHAREWIMFTYNQMVDMRKQQYEAHLATVPYYELYKIYSGRPPISQPQMHELRMQMSAAQGAYQRGIDEDWKNSLQRYPEVLDYYFNLVEFKLPGEKSIAVQEPVFGGRVAPDLKKTESTGGKRMMMQPSLPMPGGPFMMPPGGPPRMGGPGRGRMPPPFAMGMRPGGF
ncbi:hypothetical protein D6D28_09816 [Aureobasidium pullulans]|uniref:Uncharacterized protein n=2 Tax=Aureobasidium pullulans TaxID=5580 RepID=A0A4S8S3B2_AURPU|nr:hypothetical protein D6D28_09816 [Aureobasidium pullulans]